MVTHILHVSRIDIDNNVLNPDISDFLQDIPKHRFIGQWNDMLIVCPSNRPQSCCVTSCSNKSFHSRSTLLFFLLKSQFDLNLFCQLLNSLKDNRLSFNPNHFNYSQCFCILGRVINCYQTTSNVKCKLMPLSVFFPSEYMSYT